MSVSTSSRPRAWLTPRFPVEMAVASVLTLGLVLVVGEFGRQPQPEIAPAKVALQAPPRIIPLPTQSDDRTREFIERFALAHVSPPLPEAAITAPAEARAPRPPERAAAALLQPPRDRPKAPSIRTATARPEQKPTIVAREDLTPPAPIGAAPRAKSAAFRIPVVSDVADKLPSGRDILNGVGAVSRGIGSVFGRT